jgi:hypothetical protein
MRRSKEPAPDVLAARRACAGLRRSERLCTCGETIHAQQPCKTAVRLAESNQHLRGMT